MNHLTIIKQMQGDGLSLALTDEVQIDVAGEAATVKRWLPHIREHKPSIIAILSKPTVADDDRRWCSECSHYDANQHCHGEVAGTAGRYRPWQGLPRRCDSFDARDR